MDAIKTRTMDFLSLVPNVAYDVKTSMLGETLQIGSDAWERKRQQDICDRLNAQKGALTHYDCPDCLNKGVKHLVNASNMRYTVQCHCRSMRECNRNAESSGLMDLLDTRTFDAYEAKEGWQIIQKQKALNFLSAGFGKWFYIGGQNGAGKTHLCTAIVGEILKCGKTAHYMLWLDESVRLKACLTDDEKYFDMINRLKKPDVLYIDDLFKKQRGSESNAQPSSADVTLAFEIINSRYNCRDRVTIISCEYFIQELLAIDEALGSRIAERAKGFCCEINRDKSRNHRMKTGD